MGYAPEFARENQEEEEPIEEDVVVEESDLSRKPSGPGKRITSAQARKLEEDELELPAGSYRTSGF